MDGYFIRRGDKTSCGGEVTGSDSLITIMGIEHAREGDSVTCGVTGLTYQIQGGVSYITSSGLRVAGTLDSVSGCPCKASLYHTWTGSTYEKEGTPTARTAAPPPASQPGSASTRTAPAGFAPATAPSEQEDCSGCFQLINQRYLPCGLRSYALLQNGERVADSRLNEEGFSNIGTSSKPISTQLAIAAPSPVLE
ncbi:PAAR domain-containing protein [Pseudomonas putida]|uniref:PAAR domain-containing protein n=1 Tax=Pseudomonas putida TaxID=303 RepID=A0A1Q9RA74_PSEPU|nr:PAAR domain-containing protein [Pseudomonas putida]OLS64319.1 hypothetical protein PSEMO_08640 [Pseudomonas putida]